MPTYVYKFIDTGETIEVQQAFTDDGGKTWEVNWITDQTRVQ